MARRIRTPEIAVFAPGGPSAAARAMEDIELLQLSANYPECISRRIATELDRVLTLLSEGARIHSPRHWPLRPAVAFDNIARLVVHYGYHLRRCRECEKWFLATDGRRRLCDRPACAKADARKRAAMSRRREREQQERARARVTLKGASRPR
jgi:hypothetical protein